MKSKTQNPGVNFWVILSITPVFLLSYNGAPNPYPLGLLSAVAVAAGLALFSLSLSYLLANNQLVFKLIHSALMGFCFLIVATSWFYFDYFQSLYTASILAMGADITAGTQALDFTAHDDAVYLLGGCLLMGLVPVWLNQTARRPAGWLVFAVLLVFICGLAISERALSHYRDRGLPWLVPANLHPIHAFFSIESQNSTVTDNERDAFDFFQKANRSKLPGPAGGVIAPKHYNVLVVLLESVRADLMGVYRGSSPSLTPNLDDLATQGLIAPMHYSNTTHTVSAEINIWCGVFDFPGEVKLAYRPDTELTADCLPTALRPLGYETYYFHGNTAAFYNRNVLLPKLGFDHLYFYKDQSNPTIRTTPLGWGADDVTMFNTMMVQLTSRAEAAGPFFAHITTLSNHYPFRWDFSDPGFTLPFNGDIEANSIFQNYQNMVAYTDYAVGKFWREFKNSKLANDTIVVITSDHGIWQFANQNTPLIEKNERFFRAPLFIYHPEYKLDKRLEGVSSHLDIPPTLAGLLGLPEDELWIGNNLLQPDQRNAWAVIGKGSDIIYRDDNTVCYYNSDECSDNQQNCTPPHGEIKLFQSVQGSPVCHRLSGDLLGQYQLNETDASNQHLFDRARLLRSYINKKMTSD